MEGRFDITVDPARDLVRIVMGGFFDRTSFAAFVAARNEAHRSLRCAPREHLTLVDIRRMRVQTQELVGLFGGVFADPTYRSRRTGCVVASSLARIQLRRAVGDRLGNGLLFFTDPHQTEHWLLTGIDDAEAA